MPHSEFVCAWKNHLNPSASAVLKAFDELPLHQLRDPRVIQVAFSVRHQLQLLLAAGGSYARVSAYSVLLNSARGDHANAISRELDNVKDLLVAEGSNTSSKFGSKPSATAWIRCDAP